MDLAARNCLLHQNNLVKVGDFGLARSYDEGKDIFTMYKSMRLPMKWTAPDGIVSKIFSGWPRALRLAAESHTRSCSPRA